MDYLPETLMYATSEIQEVSRNIFRLETVSADSASAGRILTFNLMENAIIDTRSLKLFMDVECTGDSTAGGAGDAVFAKLPQYSSSLISQMQVYINGVQVQSGSSEYYTIAQALRLGRSNLDNENSIDRALCHSYLTAGDANDNETVCIDKWCGFLDGSTRYLNTGVLGQIQIRLTMAGNNVLVPKQTAVNLGAPINTADARANAGRITYKTTNMYFTCATISLSPMYNAMLRKRLESGGLEINYPEYYTFQLDGIQNAASVAASTRFSLSSGAINSLKTLYRDANYTATGIMSHAYPNSVGVNAFSANALRFRSYSGQTKLAGTARYKYIINNVNFPQTDSTWVDALANVAYTNDKVSHETNGNLITSAESYNDGKFIYPVLLELPTGRGVAVTAAYNSRGVNTQMVMQCSQLVVPAADVDKGDSGVASCFVIACTTAKLMVQLGRDLAVQW